MKITNLLENTVASMPDPGQTAFRSARSETSLEEMTAGGTVAGAVAPVSKPMGKTIKRESGIAKGIKKKMVDEGELSENDLILVPGQMSKRTKGFVNKDRNEMERIEMAKSDVVQSVKSAKTIFNILKNSDDEIEGWVQEKLAKAEDYLNTVREYLEGKNMQAEAQSAGVRMQRALQREKEKRERSERNAERLLNPPKQEPQKEVKEGEQDWMSDMRAMAHKISPQDKLKQQHAERQAQQQAQHQQQLEQDKQNLPELMSQFREMKSEYESLGGRNWQYADREQNLSAEERKARGMETSLRQLADRIRAAKQGSEGLSEVAPPGAKAERMVKHIKKSYAKDGKITPKEKSIAYATAWKAHNKGKVEEQGMDEDMPHGQDINDPLDPNRMDNRNRSTKRNIQARLGQDERGDARVRAGQERSTHARNKPQLPESAMDDNAIWSKYGQYNAQDLMQEFPNLSPKDAQVIVNYAEYGWSSSDPQKFRNEVVQRVKMAMGQQGVAEGSESDAYGNTGEKHECGSCDGTGIDTHDDECPECGGKGWVRDKESLKKKGVAEGDNSDVADISDSDYMRIKGIVDKKYPGYELSGLNIGRDGNIEVEIYNYKTHDTKHLKTKSTSENKQGVAEESKGLWANIHAKRERIKHGSGEHMRKPGSKGAPTADALRKSAK